jgi:hypothetical protein
MRGKHMDRSLWAEDFPIGRFPNYPCPYCARREEYGSLAEDSRTFAIAEGSALFHVFLRCRVCGDAVSVTGYMMDGRLLPKSFVPAVPLIKNPGSQGGWTGLLVEKSFELFWVDPASCANCLRSFLEGLLDDWAVPKQNTLHRRLNDFRDSKSMIEETDKALVEPILQGLRRIGNIGSHAGEVERLDLLNAFEDTEIVLGIMYGSGNETAVARIKAKIQADLLRKGQPN